MEQAGDYIRGWPSRHVEQTGVLAEDLSLLGSYVCLCDIPEGLNIYHHHCENLKFHEVSLVLFM